MTRYHARDDARPVCPRCHRPATRDCTFARCAEEAEGPETVRDVRPVGSENDQTRRTT